MSPCNRRKLRGPNLTKPHSVPGAYRAPIEGQGARHHRCKEDGHLLLCTFDTCLTFDNEDDTLTNVAAMIGDPFKLMGNPEQVRGALQNESIALKGGNSTSAGHQSH